jgi:toxin ParE1/3/4
VNVRWTQEAESERLSICEFIAADNPGAAVRMDELFTLAAERLSELPQRGRDGVVAGTGELIPHPSYRLIYQIWNEEVWILALVHTARQWLATGLRIGSLDASRRTRAHHKHEEGQ